MKRSFHDPFHFPARSDRHGLLQLPGKYEAYPNAAILGENKGFKQYLPDVRIDGSSTLRT